MSLAVNDDILWLEVAVEDVLGMQVTDGCQCLKEVKLGIGLLHPPYFPQQVEQLSAVTVLHTEHQVILGLKTKVELGDERVAIALLKYLPLIFYDILLLVLQDEVLTDDLHGHQAAVSSCEVHLRKTTSAQTLYNL